VIDGVPLVGHAKGGIHYALGDREGGDNAMKSASRTTGVIGGGVGGFLLGGPLGAVAGGIGGGLAMDGITTGVESAIHNEYMPNGTIASVTNMVTGKSESLSGDIFDLTFGVSMDGVTGYYAGSYLGKKI
jgi:hypothetical protein